MSVGITEKGEVVVINDQCGIAKNDTTGKTYNTIAEILADIDGNSDRLGINIYPGDYSAQDMDLTGLTISNVVFYGHGSSYSNLTTVGQLIGVSTNVNIEFQNLDFFGDGKAAFILTNTVQFVFEDCFFDKTASSNFGVIAGNINVVAPKFIRCLATTGQLDITADNSSFANFVSIIDTTFPTVQQSGRTGLFIEKGSAITASLEKIGQGVCFVNDSVLAFFDDTSSNAFFDNLVMNRVNIIGSDGLAGQLNIANARHRKFDVGYNELTSTITGIDNSEMIPWSFATGLLGRDAAGLASFGNSKGALSFDLDLDRPTFNNGTQWCNMLAEKDITPNDILDVYDSAGTLILTSSYQDILFNQTRELSSDTFDYNVLNGEITFLTDDQFFVMARVTTDKTTGNTRSLSSMRIVGDTGSGFIEIPGTKACMYNREINEGCATGMAALMYTATAGDKIKVQAIIDSGNSTGLEANGSGLVISGFKGVRGLQGAPGVGGNPSAGAVGDIQYSDGLGDFNATSRLNWNGTNLRIGNPAALPVYRFDQVSDGAEWSWRDSSDNPIFDYDGVRILLDMDLHIKQYIYHHDDLDTYIRLLNDQIDLVAGGIIFIRMDNATQDIMTMNQSAVDVDWNYRKEDNSDAMFYDAGNDTWVFRGHMTVVDPVKPATLLSANTTLADNDQSHVRVDTASVTITLPAIPLANKIVEIKNISGGSITIASNIGHTIESNTTGIQQDRGAWQLVFNSTTSDWEIW